MKMFRRYKTLAVITILVLMVSLGLAGCGGKQEAQAPKEQAPLKGDPIKVAIIGPMTFIHGEHMWKSATMAMEEINAAGGVKVGNQSRPVEIVKVDTNEMTNIPDAATAVERVANSVDFFLGGFRTEAVLGMQDVIMDYKKVFISTGVGHPNLTKKVKDNYDRYKYYFRTNPMNSNDMARASFLILAEVASVVKTDLGIEKPKVAIMAESAVWTDPIVAASQQQIPAMGMEVAGVWRPSAVATDVTAELSAIRASGAHIILTFMSGPVGGVFARQYEELKIPAAATGINVDAQGGKFWQVTGGKGNYVSTLNLLGRAALSPKAIPFYDKFVARYGEIPVYTAATYDALYMLVEAIERAGSIDADAVVKELEKTDYAAIGGRLVFTENHDVTWGPKHVTGLGTQWSEGKLNVFWPNGWEGIKHEGTARFVLPPWMIEHWKK